MKKIENKNKKTARTLSELEKLVNKITPTNQHDEIDWDTPVGKEVW